VTRIEPAIAVVQRVLPAPPEVVFDEWLDPVSLSDWMCPHPARAVRIELDPRVAGRLRIDIEEEGSEFSVSGTFLALERPGRIVFTWSCTAWADPELESVVTVTLEPHGPGHTLMKILHESLPDGTRERHERGWNLIAQQLENELSSS